MSEDAEPTGNDMPSAAAVNGVSASLPTTAGGLLREARQRQGLHIAALASAIKVAPRKLELLEADRLDELPDATFTRALAQTICRSLKIDAAPILALLPAAGSARLKDMGEGLNAPFLDRPASRVPTDWSSLASPALWGPALLLLAAAVVYLLPSGWLTRSPFHSNAEVDNASPASSPASADAMWPIDAASAVANGESGSAQDVASSSPSPASPSAVASNERAKPKLLQLRSSAESWVEVTDARGKVILSRLLKADEDVALDGAVPLHVNVGNAANTAVTFRGQPISLAPYTRDNLARFELN